MLLFQSVSPEKDPGRILSGYDAIKKLELLSAINKLSARIISIDYGFLEIFLQNCGNDPLPTGSMYGIFTYIYHKNQPNVGKYTIPMDPESDLTCFLNWIGWLEKTPTIDAFSPIGRQITWKMTCSQGNPDRLEPKNPPNWFKENIVWTEPPWLWGSGFKSISLGLSCYEVPCAVLAVWLLWCLYHLWQRRWNRRILVFHCQKWRDTMKRWRSLAIHEKIIRWY